MYLFKFGRTRGCECIYYTLFLETCAAEYTLRDGSSSDLFLARRMADDTGRVLRRSGIPNPDAYKAAQKKFKAWDKSAITEYDRLSDSNAKKPLTASTYPVEHARYYHLCELKSKREFVVVFSIIMFR